jgi:hypothetical protein
MIISEYKDNIRLQLIPSVLTKDKGTSVTQKQMPSQREQYMKGKCALGPFLSILVIEYQHKCLNVNLCPWMDKVQIKVKGMFLRLSTLFYGLMYCV